MPDISAIICTHNPRPDYLRRVLDALKAQTLPQAEWELLLIDNASKEPLAEHWDLSWHLHARHIREDELGLTPARLRGIKESRGRLLVFVDDDNILAADYLQVALRFGSVHRHLGAWGGSYIAEFEIRPPYFLEKYLNRLAVSTVVRPRWSNSYLDFEAIPSGAGMVLRRVVAERYENMVAEWKLRKRLDRTGKALASCGDTDIAWTAIDLGSSVGRFPDLKLTHLIPRQRLEPEYILALIEGDASSRVLLDHVRKQKTFPSNVETSLIRALWLRLRLTDFDYRAWNATIVGIRKGFSILETFASESTD